MELLVLNAQDVDFHMILNMHHMMNIFQSWMNG